jgi:hypothetical protein
MKRKYWIIFYIFTNFASAFRFEWWQIQIYCSKEDLLFKRLAINGFLFNLTEFVWQQREGKVKGWWREEACLCWVAWFRKGKSW